MWSAPAGSSAPKRQRIDTAQADRKGVIKEEPLSPPKMPCLNHSLVKPKVEADTTPERRVAPAQPLLDAPAAPAAAAVPVQTAQRPLWQVGLIKTQSKLCLSLSSPPPPRGRIPSCCEVGACGMEAPAPRHNRPAQQQTRTLYYMLSNLTPPPSHLRN